MGPGSSTNHIAHRLRAIGQRSFFLGDVPDKRLRDEVRRVNVNQRVTRDWRRLDWVCCITRGTPNQTDSKTDHANRSYTFRHHSLSSLHPGIRIANPMT